MQRVKVTCTGTGCAEEQLLVPLAHLIVLCGCIRQMGQAKDRRLTRLRLPVAEFDSIERGPRIPPRGASHESLMQPRNRSKRVGRNIKMACRWTVSEVATWLRNAGFRSRSAHGQQYAALMEDGSIGSEAS